MPEVRLIDANALLKSEIERCHCVPLVCTTDLNGIACDCNSLKNVLDRQPTIEPEQRHGEWKCIGEYEEFSEEMADYLCVNCGYVISRLKNQKPNFCENCGRDMRATDTNVGGKGGADNG